MSRDVLLIQPPLLHSNLNTDVIQEAYWKVLKQKVYSIISNMPDSIHLKEHKDNFTGFIEPNICLFYIAGSLRKAGFHLDYLDFHILDSEIRLKDNRAISEKDIEYKLSDHSCDFVMISPLTVNFHWAVKIAGLCKRINPESITVVGGVHASFEYENILKKYQSVDYVIVGEGELSSVQLLQNLIRGTDIDSIDGIAYRQNGSVQYTGKPQPIADLDSLPYPDYSLISKEYIGNSMLRVITSRG
ncbi:MAG: cobalamin-dependent protein [Nitrospiraceae bacterium]|nr:MAG: cobalamin-dependent protein [Nitrospiraceae bacterium]